MNYLTDITFAILSTTLCLTVAFIFFAFFMYILNEIEKRKGNDMKLAHLEAIYFKWKEDKDYTDAQALDHMGEIFIEEEENERREKRTD